MSNRTLQERAEIFVAALNALGASCDLKHAEIVLRITDKMHETDGNLSLQDITVIRKELDAIQPDKSDSEMSDLLRKMAAFAVLDVVTKRYRNQAEADPQQELEKARQQLAELESKLQTCQTRDGIDNLLDEISETKEKIRELEARQGK